MCLSKYFFFLLSHSDDDEYFHTLECKRMVLVIDLNHLLTQRDLEWYLKRSEQRFHYCYILDKKKSYKQISIYLVHFVEFKKGQVEYE
jgi:hypothetical protein